MTPKPNTSRSNTPRNNKTTKIETPPPRPFDQNGKSIDVLKSSRSIPSPSLSSRTVTEGASKLTPRKLDRDRRATPTRMQVTCFTEPESPKFNISQSGILPTQGNEEEEATKESIKSGKKTHLPLPTALNNCSFSFKNYNETSIRLKWK